MNQTPQTGFLESACFATSVNNAILRQQNKRKATFQYDDVSGGNIMTFKRDRGEIQQSGTNLSHSPYHSYYHSSQERSPERKIANSTGTPSSRTNGFTQRTFNNDDHSDDDEDFSTAAEGAYYHHPSWLGMNPNEEEGEAQQEKRRGAGCLCLTSLSLSLSLPLSLPLPPSLSLPRSTPV